MKKIRYFKFYLLSLCLSIIAGTLFLFHLQAQLSYKLKPGQPLPSDLFIKLAKKINPTVVNISTAVQQGTQNLLYFNDPFFDFFFSPRQPDQRDTPPQNQSLGTGFIIRSNGLILTNTHVINQANLIQVQLRNSDNIYKAKLIGKDRYTDVALIKIEAGQNLPAAELGESSALQVGEWVAAFGNPFGHSHTMTKGIISAMNREIDELNLFPFLQTDAIINPGNSGGPLVNTAGKVIGINTAMRTQGISFAIPIDNVKVVLADLEKYGKVRRGFIGVKMDQYISRNGKKTGALIMEVINGTPAEKAGIKAKDIIIRFNNKKIASSMDLVRAVAATPINQSTSMDILRNKKKITLNIVVRAENTIAQNNQKTQNNTNKKVAPFNLGFSMVTGTKKGMKSMGLPPLNRAHPIITKVKAGSPSAFAGLRKKDIILKVNGRQTLSIRSVQRRLFKNRTNYIHILRYRPYSKQYVNMIFQINVR